MKCNTKTLYFQPKPQPAILRRHGHARKPSDGAKQDLFPIVEDKVVSDNQHQKNQGSSTSSEATVKANTIKEVCACCLKFELKIYIMNFYWVLQACVIDRTFCDSYKKTFKFQDYVYPGFCTLKYWKPKLIKPFHQLHQMSMLHNEKD